MVNYCSMTVIHVRKLEKRDLPTRVKWFNALPVYTQMPLEIPISLADTEEWFMRNRLNDHRRDFSFVIEQGEAEVIVAMGGLVDINHYHRRAELYMVVNPELFGKGIGGQATRWLCNFGFVVLDLRRIYLFTLYGNERARRMYESIGFLQEGVLRQHHFHNGAYHDRCIYGLLKSDWQKQPWSITEGPISFEFSLAQNIEIGAES